MSDKKDCEIKSCRYFDTSFEGNCKLDRCIYVAKGTPKEGKLRQDTIGNLIAGLTDEELLEFSREVGVSSIYEEEPVGIREFILSSDYLDLGEDGRIWEENVNILENIFDPKYDEAYVLGGIGAGKSTISAIAALYSVYRVMILKNPHDCYRMVQSSPIEIVIISINEALAKDIIFTYAYNMCANSNFFRRRQYAPNQDIKSRLSFPKNISIVPLSGSKTAGISRNVLVGLMDEASHYPCMSTGDKASIQYSNLSRRVKSRFAKSGLDDSLLRGKIISVSSPSNMDDFMERTFRKKKDDPRIYLKRCTSFETKDVGEYSGKTFNFCIKCVKAVGDSHIRKHHDIIIETKHERKVR